jgi:hypothetical protein
LRTIDNRAPETQSGLDAWRRLPLPSAPRPRGFQWLSVVGPGVIVLGASIGSGEFLIGPAAIVKYGLTLLWVTTCGAALQTHFNTELMRYTLATGEPVFTGFMRTRPSWLLWAWIYVVLYILNVGWPAWAGAAAGSIFFLVNGTLPGAQDAETVYRIAIGGYGICFLVLLFGRSIERTLELLNWLLVVVIIGTFSILAIVFVPGATWWSMLTGFVGFSPSSRSFNFMPTGADWFLMAAFAGASGAGGVVNLTLTNWARDKGYGMSKASGFIPAAVGGGQATLEHVGATFEPDQRSMKEWRAWWRIMMVDQWGIFFAGAMLGMALPAMLYATFIPVGSDIRGYGAAAALAQAMGTQLGAVFGTTVALLGVWILFKTQLDLLEGITRAITDLLWSGPSRVRRLAKDPRRLYYSVLAVAVLWGLIALRLAQPIFLLQLAPNVGAVVFVIAGIHIWYVNTRLLPPGLRPSIWRRAGLAIFILFYGVFAFLSLMSIINP